MKLITRRRLAIAEIASGDRHAGITVTVQSIAERGGADSICRLQVA